MRHCHCLTLGGVIIIIVEFTLGSTDQFTSSRSVPQAACPATWPMSLWRAECAANLWVESGCGVEVSGQANGVEGRQVGYKAWPSRRL